MLNKGTLTHWNNDKGYGFISPDKEKQKVFVHIREINAKKGQITPGLRVRYRAAQDEQGRPCAQQCQLSGMYLHKMLQLVKALSPLLLVCSFLGGAASAVYFEYIPPFVFALYLLFSLITFGVYAYDKFAARRGKWRTQENSLHALSLIGGWPGALAAQKLLRHKSSKQPFRTVFWVTAILNGGIFFWLLTPQGADSLQLLVSGIIWSLTLSIG